jgi:hypothetical protein
MTNAFPNIGYTYFGRDNNYFNKLEVTATGFGSNSADGYQPDMVITFPTYTVTFQLEGTGVIQYSFNGQTIHGDMNSSTTGFYSANLTFANRVISKIWFKVISGTPTVRVEAWALR